MRPDFELLKACLTGKKTLLLCAFILTNLLIVGTYGCTKAEDKQPFSPSTAPESSRSDCIDKPSTNKPSISKPASEAKKSTSHKKSSKRKKIVKKVSAYNAGDPSQTNGNPCISADGSNICRALERGERVCAANFVPLGTRIHVEGVGVCTVRDRTCKRYANRVDVAMKRHETEKAVEFGIKKLSVTILE